MRRLIDRANARYPAITRIGTTPSGRPDRSAPEQLDDYTQWLRQGLAFAEESRDVLPGRSQSRVIEFFWLCEVAVFLDASMDPRALEHRAVDRSLC